MTTVAISSQAGIIDWSGPYKLSIGGKLVDGTSTFDVVNPATDEVIAQAPAASAQQMDEAVAAARAAFPAWSALSWEERSAYVQRYADALEAQSADLARLLTTEQGKPLKAPPGRVGAEAETGAAVYWVREVGLRKLPVEVMEDTDEHWVEVHHTPLGVVGAILPWNFPVLLGLWKVAPCLITGNTMVLKPAPTTPLTSLRFGEIAQEIFPPGVLNIVSGPNELGQQLTEHPNVDKISFTGSTATGKKIMASSSGTLKRVTLELGGNDPAIVLPGAEVTDELVNTLFEASFGNSGQWCIAVKRLYVHDSIYDAFRDKFVAIAASKKVGNGLEEGVDFGPIQNKMQYGKLIDMFADVEKNGYEVPVGGKIDESLPGNFVPLTVVDNPPHDSRIVQEEPFGPILPLIKYSDVDEAVAKANDTRFGLGGSVWGPQPLANEVALRIETGTVWVNEIHVHGIDLPFGGHKESGVGVENGAEGLAEFTNTKTLMFKK
ncbi:MAG TPA: aldehyde dehydrogenase family protein [Sporichthyaceae bacterium]|nr:aldehyde dehydrogenase family protein [Sporichthyaceae bacterium]